MMIREPVAAGEHYPVDAEACRSAMATLLEPPAARVPGTVLAGLVPHASWALSGSVTAAVFQVLAASRRPDLVVLIGGVHRSRGRQAALFPTGRWVTPVGDLRVDARFAERLLGHTNLIVEDAYAHESEHSLEVQTPFIKHLFPAARIVPMMVPPVSAADEVGEAVGRTLKAYGYNAVIIGTTDLTHYGPYYGFIPRGIGAEGNAWAKSVNDRRFLERLCQMKPHTLVAEAREHKNACSAGAAAATVAAAVSLGATEAVVLKHTSSGEVVAARGEEAPADSVGYAGVVFTGGGMTG